MGINLGRVAVALARGSGAFNKSRYERDQQDFERERELAREQQTEAFRRDQLDARREQAQQMEQYRRDQLRASQETANANRTGSLERMQMQLAQQRELAKMGDQTRRDIAQQSMEGRENMARLAASLRPQGSPLKPVPNAVAAGYLGNQKQLQTIDQTIADIQANPGALGAKALIPDMILNRLPGKSGQGGVMARAGVGDVGSLIIHDRTGATMAVAEARRLQPFIPSPTDDSKTALTKLRRLRALLAEETEALQDFYTPEQGYRGLGGGSRPDFSNVQGGGARYRPTNPFAK
jgi:hypothetical protein